MGISYPLTAEYIGKRGVSDFGYSFSIEVGDIQAEYSRMQYLGFEFVSIAYAAWRILAGICTRYRWEFIFTTSGGEFKLSLLGAKFGTLNLNGKSAVKYQFE